MSSLYGYIVIMSKDTLSSTVAIRIEPADLARIKAFRDGKNTVHGRRVWSVSDAARYLMLRSLTQLEARK